MRMAHSNFAVAKRSLTVSLAAGMVMAFTALVFAEPGNISPEKIKIDINANLTDDNVGIVDDGTINWIRDNVLAGPRGWRLTSRARRDYP